jgi:predicted transcriptional regulator
MTDERTISWIFLATALASKVRPAKFSEISELADGINHAVPNHKELQDSITWLTRNGLVMRSKNKYQLTDRGQEILEQAEEKSKILFKIRDELEIKIADIKNNVA